MFLRPRRDGWYSSDRKVKVLKPCSLRSSQSIPEKKEIRDARLIETEQWLVRFTIEREAEQGGEKLSLFEK